MLTISISTINGCSCRDVSLCIGQLEIELVVAESMVTVCCEQACRSCIFDLSRYWVASPASHGRRLYRRLSL